MKKTLTVKQLCVLAMLVAITVVLSYITGNLRIGNSVKFSVSFISVYVSAALFGPLWGGFVGAAADVVSHFVNPVGAYIWQFTLIEFFYGFLYGMFFYKKFVIKRNGTEKNAGKVFLSVFLCISLQFVISLFYKTYVLTKMGYMPDLYRVNVYARLIPTFATAILKSAAIYIFERRYIVMFYETV